MIIIINPSQDVCLLVDRGGYPERQSGIPVNVRCTPLSSRGCAHRRLVGTAKATPQVGGRFAHLCRLLQKFFNKAHAVQCKIFVSSSNKMDPILGCYLTHLRKSFGYISSGGGGADCCATKCHNFEFKQTFATSIFIRLFCRRMNSVRSTSSKS
jgi:hypothetical protein